MCRVRQRGADAKRRGWKIDGHEAEIWEESENWILGWKKMLNRGANMGDSRIWYRGRVVWREKGEMENGKYDHEEGRRKDQRVEGRPAVFMVVIGWRGAEGAEKSWGLAFFFVSLYFLPGVSRFGCGLRPSGSMWVSIARIRSSISDNCHDGVTDQRGEGARQQKQGMESKSVINCNAIKTLCSQDR